MKKGENSAEELIVDFDLKPPINPAVVCDALSSDEYVIGYKEDYISSDKFLGVSIGNEKGAQILINRNIGNQGRKNFTGSHEIGHVIMHIQTSIQSEFRCSQDDIYGQAGRNIEFEREANDFASSLLMPKSFINLIIGTDDLSWSLIQSISQDCDTSLEATARRVIELSLDKSALIIHKNNEMWTPIKSPSFQTYLNKIPFPKHLDTYPDLTDRKLPKFLDECDTSDWIINNYRLPDNIKYSSIYNEEFNRIMTILVIPDIDDDIDDEWEAPKFKR